MFRKRKGKYDYLTNDWNLNKALNEIDSELTHLRIAVEETPSYRDLEELEQRLRADFEKVRESIRELRAEIEIIKKRREEDV